MTTPETPAEVLAEMRDKMKDCAGVATRFVRDYLDRLERSLAAGKVAGEMDRTAPPKVWLQIDTNGDAEDRSEAIPRTAWDDLTWCYESIGGQEVEYIRADLACTAPPADPAKASVDEAIEHLLSGIDMVTQSGDYELSDDAVYQLQACADDVRLGNVGSFAAKASGSAPDDLLAFDEAVEKVLPKISELEFNSRRICAHFAKELRSFLSKVATPPASAPEVTDHDIHHATSAEVKDPHHNGGAAWQWQRGVLHHKSVGCSNWVKVSNMSPTRKRILAIAAALTAALQDGKSHG